MDTFAGWPAVAAIGLMLLGLAMTACRIAVRGLFGALSVAVLSFPVMWLLAKFVFGDVSRYLPAAIFSDGADGKDQIIIASILCTILGGVIIAAGAVWLLRRIDGLTTRKP